MGYELLNGIWTIHAELTRVRKIVRYIQYTFSQKVLEKEYNFLLQNLEEN